MVLEQPPAEQQPKDYFDLLREKGLKIESTGEQWPDVPVSRKGFEALPDEQFKFVEGLAEMFRDYLSQWVAIEPAGAPVFANHQERRAWRHDMEAKHGIEFNRFWDRNKLKLNNTAAMRSYFEALVMFLDMHNVHTQEAELVRALWQKFPPVDQEAYQTMSDDERMRLITRVDEVARAFLTLVTRTEPARY